MQVSLKQVSANVDQGQGMELAVNDREGIHVGNLLIDENEIVWCAGKTPHQQGQRVSWASFIEFMENS